MAEPSFPRYKPNSEKIVSPASPAVSPVVDARQAVGDFVARVGGLENARAALALLSLLHTSGRRSRRDVA